MEEKLNKDFSNVCDWFINNKLSIGFGKNKTKSIPFGTKKKLNNEDSLGIRYGTIQIKQYHTVTCLGVALDEDLSGKSMAVKVIKKTILVSIILPHFKYAYSVWYSNLNKNLKTKFQTLKNKSVHLSLNLSVRAHLV